MSESDLAAQVVAWLTEQHWDVYQEVQFGRSGKRADIVAVRCGLLWIIECKAALTFKVLEQASGWSAHFRSVAVPFRNQGDRILACQVAHDYLQLGILEVLLPHSFTPPVKESRPAPLLRCFHRASLAKMAALRPEHQTRVVAGSNGGGYYTPYRATMERVIGHIVAHPGCSLKEIMDSVGNEHHYTSTACARSAIRSALYVWERDKVEYRRENDHVTFWPKEKVAEEAT